MWETNATFEELSFFEKDACVNASDLPNRNTVASMTTVSPIIAGDKYLEGLGNGKQLG